MSDSLFANIIESGRDLARLNYGVFRFGKGPTLHVISRKKLLEAVERQGGLGVVLDAWYRTAKAARWRSLEEVSRIYRHADGVPVGERVYTVFNISGNSFRLVAEIYYEDQVLLVRHVLTHAEYDKGDWRK